MGDTSRGQRESARGAAADRSTPDPPYVPGQRPRNAWVAPGSSDVVQDPADDAPDGPPEPTRRRRLLARIPGLSRLAEQSGWVDDGHPVSPGEDPGWVFHDGDEPGAFRGWLYYYADGTMVDADGTQYAFPDEAQPEQAETDVDPAPEEETEQEADSEPDEEPEAEDASGVEAETEAEAQPNQETAPEEEAAPQARQESKTESSNDGEGAAEAKAPAAELRQQDELMEPVAREAPGAHRDIPGFVEYSPTNVRGYAFGTVFLVSAVVGVLTVFVASSEDSTPALVIAGCCFVLALVSWWALVTWKPTVVSIRDGVLDISRGGHSDHFELEDPSTVVEFTGRPGSPGWTAVVKHANGPRTILRSSHVKPRQFERIVRHHRARQKPAENG